jgi:hypothetical protein
MTTTTRRLMLGLASAATLSASLVVSSAVAADAASTYATTGADGQVTSFDIITTPKETQELVDTDTMHGGYGAFSAGDWTCSGDPHVYARQRGFVLDSERCGIELTKCAKALSPEQRQTQVAAMTWYPDFPAQSGGSYVCYTQLTGDPDLVVRAAQLLAGG